MFLSIKYALQYIKHNMALSIATTLIILITFILINALISAQVVVDKTADYLNEQQKISIIYEPDTSGEIITNFKNKLSALPAVKDVIYKDSKNLQKQNLKSLGLSDEEIDSIVTNQENFVKILQIKLKPNSDQKAIIDMIEQAKQEGAPIVSFIYFENLIHKIQTVSNGLKITGLVVTGALIIISIQLIYLTISFTVTKMSNEIKTMYLVGANKNKVTQPFAIQGAVYGLIAAFLAYILLIGLLLTVKIAFGGNNFIQTLHSLLSNIGFNHIIQRNTLLATLGVEVIIGLFLGYVFGNMAANNTIKRLNYD